MTYIVGEPERVHIQIMEAVACTWLSSECDWAIGPEDVTNNAQLYTEVGVRLTEAI